MASIYDYTYVCIIIAKSISAFYRLDEEVEDGIFCKGFPPLSVNLGEQIPAVAEIHANVKLTSLFKRFSVSNWDE